MSKNATDQPNNIMSGSQSLPRFVQLAQTISSSVTQLQETLLAHNVPFPSFDEDGAFEVPNEASNIRDVLIDATVELHDLLLDPVSLLLIHGGHTNMISLQAITRFKIADMIPEKGQACYEDIAEKTCLSEPVLRRILQSAMAMRIFHEPEPGMVAHTKVSKLFMNPQIYDWLSTHTEEGWPSAVKMVDALEKWPKSQEPNESGFSLANNTTESIYSIMAADSKRAKRFANFMETSTSSYEYDAVHAINNYDWASLGKATVVDVGGSQGHVAIQLAKHFGNLEIVVQDIETVVDGADGKLPEELRGRLHFEAHDFFQPQIVKADVYFLRLVLHNWSDKYAVRILRALIPALKHGSRVVIMDACMKERGVLPLWKEKIVRTVDMMMGVLLNARERTYGEWKALLAEADHGFILKEVIEPQESALALIDVRWNG
ncbi:sterigmatocystin 8-O-methyltransferase [Xylariaceae sp. AK1471]|nr:sterigmatocystin 8-O-methyltransferase [Xylariaceae sp. AK1471]